MPEKNKVLITGAAGFIGAHMVGYILDKTDWDIVCLDRYNNSGNINRLAALIPFVERHRVRTVFHDLKAEINDITSAMIGKVNYVIHFAASSHVDNSIKDPVSFMMDNAVGTTNLLRWAIGSGPLWLENEDAGLLQGGKFINFSTDEVFGPAAPGYAHKEDDPHKPSNPYSASKSAQEAAGVSAFITYGLPVITTHTMNNFGEMQHPEKLIPKTIRSVINGVPMPIYAALNDKGELQAVGSRYWIHCTNTASAVLFLLANGNAGGAYNIIGFDELSNLEIALTVASIIGKPLITDFVDFHKARPGHDMRYALDGSKMRDMGWAPEVDFQESLKRTVQFSLDNPTWQ